MKEKNSFNHMTLAHFTELSKTCKKIWSAEVRIDK